MRKLHLQLVSSSVELTVPTVSTIPFSSSTAAATAQFDGNAGPSPPIIRREESPASALRVLELLDAGSLPRDRALYSDLVKICTRSGNLAEARIVHTRVKCSSFKDDPSFRIPILNMYARCGGMRYARKLFNKMPQRDVVAWTSLITGYTQNDMPDTALEMFRGMVGDGLAPVKFTFSSLLKAAGACKWDGAGRQVHAFCIKYGLDQNVYVGTALVDMYARQGRMNDACLALDCLESKNEAPWNALIAGYERKRQGEVAFRLYCEMQKVGIKPTAHTYSSVLCACASIGNLELGRSVHAHLIKTGEVIIPPFVGIPLVDMYAKSGSIQDAWKVFRRLSKGLSDTWNAMFRGYAQHGLAKEAIRLFKAMRKCEVKPDGMTFLCILTVCSHGGLLAEGWHCFKSMKKYDVKPGIEHYVAMVNLLGRAGALDQAWSLIKGMPIWPTAAVWGALLDACRMHTNVELGKYAAERLLSSNHVIRDRRHKCLQGKGVN